jgi:hypothetical protein
MEVDQLTDEQIANLTPEQITMLEEDPSKLAEFLGVKEEPEPEEKESVANDAGEDEPKGVSTKSGKGIIPYEKHKELRVENSTLREQLQDAKSKLDELTKQKDEAKTEKAEAKADDAIAKHLDRLKDDMPELHELLSSVMKGSKDQSDKLNETLEELKREKQEAKRVEELSVKEQVAEAKDNNPDLTLWETSDPEAWDEALKQDTILRESSKWALKTYSERFDEVVRRVRAIMPEASALKKADEPDQTKAKAKAKLDAAPARKPTTLSDIQGGEQVTSEKEQMSNLTPSQLVAKLRSMPDSKAAAMRADLD